MDDLKDPAASGSPAPAAGPGRVGDAPPAVQVTVAVLCYNAAPWVVECLESVRDQSLGDVALIVIDDGSTDGSASVIRDWIETNRPDAVVRLHQENRGVVARANEALGLVTTPLFQILGADDSLMAHKLEAQVAAMGDDPSIALCFSDMAVVDESGEVIAASARRWHRTSGPGGRSEPGSEGAAALMLRGAGFSAPTWLVRTDLARAVGGYDTRFHQEDVPFFLKLATRYGIAQVDESLVRYRRHATNLSSSIPNSATSILGWCDLLLELRAGVGDDEAWLPQYRRRVYQLIASPRRGLRRRQRVTHAWTLAQIDRRPLSMRLKAIAGIGIAVIGVGLPDPGEVLVRLSPRRRVRRRV